ncbi:type I-E CRISPR-associated protein Cse2/CasB [Granulibacter bethesdensis]|uniref:type I-E CRISPR-associated protein Cse2/CasB n=1 Tax=Granulibacter bethesdensis TaxID=364410 RepID=UPI0009356544|nr:type I-E CRISPR-associated protein Cse2/CasB [Granulibacter bethesdensis]
MSDSKNQTKQDIDQVISKLALELAKLSPGNLASLRRAIPGHGCPEFWRLFYSQKLDQHRIPHSKDNEQAWEWVMIAIARLTPTGQPVIRSGEKEDFKLSAHDPELSLGQALSDANVPEIRVVRLLSAPFVQRREMMMRLIHVLSAARARFNMYDIARLLAQEHHDLRAADNPLRKLAKDYYHACDKKSAKEKETANA